jgi:hypothetical protein
MNREDVYAALLALAAPLVNSGDLKTTSRRLVLAEEEAVESLPGLYQNQTKEVPSAVDFDGHFIWKLSVDWYLYIGAADSTAVNTTALNPLVDKVLNLLPNPNNQFVFTVGGKCLELGLDGPLQYWEGLLNDRAVVRIGIFVGNVTFD